MESKVPPMCIPLVKTNLRSISNYSWALYPNAPLPKLVPSLENSEGVSVRTVGWGFYTPAGIGLVEVWLVQYLKERDFVPLHVGYRLITSLR
jgi:hypothetical protein